MSEDNTTQKEQSSASHQSEIVSNGIKVLSIGPDKDLLKEGSESCRRHTEYARYVTAMHMIVFSRKGKHGHGLQVSENAWSYATDSSCALSMLYGAYTIGRKILKEKGEWVISAQDPFESGFVGYALSRMTGTPLLVQEHGDFFSASYWRKESLLNSLRFFVGLWIVRHADHVRTVSKRIQETLVGLGVPEEKTSIAPVYTDVATFARASPKRELLELKDYGEVIILSMARFVPQKNLPLLIRSFIGALEKGARAKLVLVGKGPLKKKVESLAESAPEGTVVFFDWTDDPASFIKSADMYALSSNYEGWGRVCIEAFASGTPLIMTDVGCAVEVAVDGKNALVVPVEDEWALTEGLYRLATDAELRKAFREEGKKTVASLPTFSEYAELYIESLKKTLKNS